MKNKSKLSKVNIFMLASFASIVANAQTQAPVKVEPTLKTVSTVVPAVSNVVKAAPVPTLVASAPATLKPTVVQPTATPVPNISKSTPVAAPAVRPQVIAQPVPVAVIPYEGKTLDKIKAKGKLVIGVRTSSIPLSFTVTGKEDSKAIGYAVDICNLIADKYKQKNNLTNIPVEYMFVTAKTRINKVKSGEVDMECGSTTNNSDRRKDIDFSIPYYIAGAKILVKTNAGINDLSDLKGKTVAYIKETTMAKVIENLNKNRSMNITGKEYGNSDDAFAGLEKNEAIAFMYDDLILFGIKANATNPSQYAVVGNFISIEPESIMIRKNDKEFTSFINQEMVSLIKSGQIDNLYSKWFLNPIPPKNQNLNIAQSSLLKDVFRDPTTIVGN
jgi:glutamate/aspartate transport system substrate-binding protein